MMTTNGLAFGRVTAAALAEIVCEVSLVAVILNGWIIVTKMKIVSVV
jgi:hypothetical protein